VEKVLFVTNKRHKFCSVLFKKEGTNDKKRYKKEVCSVLFCSVKAHNNKNEKKKRVLFYSYGRVLFVKRGSVLFCSVLFVKIIKKVKFMRKG